MLAKCKLDKSETIWPCEFETCPYFGQCDSEWKAELYRQPTNADRIRAMSDEELGDFLQRMIDVGDISEVYCAQKPECFDLVDSVDGIPVEWCRKCLMDWLRQPAKEEDS